MLAEVDLAEEGVLQLLLASIHRLSSRSGSDNEVAISSKYVLFPGNIFGLSFEIQFMEKMLFFVHIYLLNCNVQTF